MGASIRPDPVQDYLSKYGPPAKTAAAPANDPVAHYLSTYKSEQPGVLSRAGDIVSNIVHHPIDAISSAVTAPLRSAYTLARASAENQAASDIGSIGGDPSSVERTVSPKEAGAAGLQTLVNVALPGISQLGAGPLARVATTLGGGALAGAAYNPNDPKAGAVAGLMLAPAAAAVGHGVSGAASTALDAFGRPATGQPIQALGVRLGDIQSLPDRAAQVNARMLASSPSSNGMDVASTKPVAPLDAIGTAGVRAARGLKTSSPAAESIITDALRGRSDNAVDRVIQHGLETTGLASRDNGVQLVDDMTKQRTANANANYGPVWQQYTAPLDNAEFSAVAKTPAGQEAVRRGMKIAANEGEKMASVPGAASGEFDPSTLNAQQRGMYDKLLPINGGQVAPTLAALKALGEQLPEATSPEKQIAPTLKQAHYVKLGFDDMLAGAPEPGSGGTGPNYARSVSRLRGRWLDAMDSEAPEYADARKQYADESTLIRAGELGQNLFKMHPDVAAKEIADLPTDAQEVARRTGFDALAERIENGPADVERGVGKSRDMKRMRLLFPDDASFDAFKKGLSEEAQMHANEQGVLGGSNTADKLSDIANMAGITLPDVMRAAATGRFHRLAGQAAANLTRSALKTSSDALSVERARQLTAGANGDVNARMDAMNRMATPKEPGNRFESTLSQSLFDYYKNRGRFLPATATGNERRARALP